MSSELSQRWDAALRAHLPLGASAELGTATGAAEKSAYTLDLLLRGSDASLTAVSVVVPFPELDPIEESARTVVNLWKMGQIESGTQLVVNRTGYVPKI